MLPATFANVIVPFFAGYTQAGFLLLIPIIIIETILLIIILKRKWRESLKFCAIANTISTIVGVLLIVVEITAYIVPFFGIFLLFLFPGACALSIWVEYKTYKRLWQDIIPKKKLLKAVIIVNIITYIPLLVLGFHLHSQNYDKRLEKPRRINCSSNLKQISTILTMYAQDYNNLFPNKPGSEGLEQLRLNSISTDYHIYKCPSANTPSGKHNKKLSDKAFDYVYQNGLKFNKKDSQTPLVWDKPTNHKNYGNVLFINGQVKSFKGKDWMKQAGIKK